MIKRKARIFDVDGTLCNVDEIRHHVMGGRRNFDAFHLESVNCPPNLQVVEAAQKSAAEGIAPLIVTARQTKYRNVTAFWLAMHHIPSERLYMRRTGDQRADYLVKLDILARIQNSWEVVEAYDDNPSVIENVWAANGIPYVLVPGWPEGENA